ncbi:MAG: hypothetical protein ACSLEN_07210 [Candidatus Malihini olakiniferum]
MVGEPRAILGEVYARQPLNAQPTGLTMGDDVVARYLVKVRMRERYGKSFQTLLSSEIVRRSQPANVMNGAQACLQRCCLWLFGMELKDATNQCW